MREWRDKASMWCASQVDVFKFLRNPLPTRSVTIEEGEIIHVHPDQIEQALMSFWNGLETWTEQDYDRARRALEEHYSFLLLRVGHASVLLPMHLADIAKRAKPSAFGLDGWTHSEVAALPMQAWFWFLIVCGVSPLSLLTSVWIPLSKTGRHVCAPKDVRPIDVFSVLMRVPATASTRMVKPWARQVLHPGQYATQGGVLMALGKIAWDTELSLVGCRSLRGISLDFETMFNMRAGLIAAEVASYMGLSFGNIVDLIAPVLCAVGTWRLPMSALPTPFATPRGLPQGESAISPVLWRISRAIPEVSVCAYVDDVNMITGSRDHLVRVVAFVKEFADHFTLSLSQAKTKLWASDSVAHEQLHADFGFGVDRSLCALGGEWPTNRGAQTEV